MFITVVPDQTIASVVDVLTRNRSGVAPVADQDGRLVGIISERAVIHGRAELDHAVLGLPVHRLMTILNSRRIHDGAHYHDGAKTVIGSHQLDTKVGMLVAHEHGRTLESRVLSGVAV